MKLTLISQHPQHFYFQNVFQKFSEQKNFLGINYSPNRKQSNSKLIKMFTYSKKLLTETIFEIDGSSSTF